MLAVMKAGGAYIPLDIDLPKDRIKFILNDANVDILITNSTITPPEEISAKILQLDQEQQVLVSNTENLELLEVTPNHVLYLIYTSGSTGNPKGVQICHRSAVNTLIAMQKAPGMTSNDITVAMTTISFDIAQLECFLPLISGAQVYMMPANSAADMSKVKDILSASKATVLQATPASWRLLLASGWKGDSNLKILCGGEALTRDLANELLTKCESLWNMYGPTETTIWSCVKKVKSEDCQFEYVPIGGPCSNFQFFVVDSKFQLVPLGGVGELFIAGDSVAVGYLNRPELNAEKFLSEIPAKWYERHVEQYGSTRIYRTGDLVRWLEDGSLEFIGRTDHQVKIRGYRIELGEIESVLKDHSLIKEAVVVAREDNPGDKRLVAYLMPKDESSFPSHEELRKYSSTRLPKYMIPASFVKITQWKLNSNGKIDRKALPTPERNISNEEEQQQLPFASPRDFIEKQLKCVFEEVLQCGQIGIFDNFFELGGHSILGIQVSGKIETIFKVTIPYSTILHASTVDSLASVIRKTISEQGLEISPIVDIQPRGHKNPFFCVNPALKSVLCYGALSHYLGEDQPFFGLEPRKIYNSIEEMGKDYMHWILKKQSTGPYQIGGWSFGCTVAYELARQMREVGLEVHLYIMDGRAPIYSEEYLALDVDALQLTVLFRGIKHYFGTKAFQISYPDLIKISQDQRIFHLMDLMDEDALPTNLSPEVAIGLFSKFRLDFTESEELSRKYQPKSFSGRVVLLKAEEPYVISGVDDPLIFHPNLGWEQVCTQKIEVVEVPGDHDSMVFQPHVVTLAERLKKSLL